MDEVVRALRAQQDELHELVAELGEADLLRQSRCDAWTVADVLLHLAQTNEMATASTAGRLPAVIDARAAELPASGSIDEWAGALVDLERTSPLEARDRWLRSAEEQVDAFTRCAPDARLLWVAGDLAARSLAATRLTETWIHTVDVAVAFGPEPAPTDRLWHTARLVWRTVPYAFTRAGVELHGSVGLELEAPDGSAWSFGDDDQPVTVIRGTARDLCTVAGQRASAAETGLSATGPDAEAALALIRTFA